MVNICFSISAVIKVEYLDVCRIAECYSHCASISIYYGSISIFLREQLPRMVLVKKSFKNDF